MLNEVRQPLSDFVDLYCRSVAESQITDSVDFLPTVTAAVVNDVMHAVQQVKSTSTALCCLLLLFWISQLINLTSCLLLSYVELIALVVNIFHRNIMLLLSGSAAILCII